MMIVQALFSLLGVASAFAGLAEVKISHPRIPIRSVRMNQGVQRRVSLDIPQEIRWAGTPRARRQHP